MEIENFNPIGWAIAFSEDVEVEANKPDGHSRTREGIYESLSTRKARQRSHTASPRPILNASRKTKTQANDSATGYE
jgi:hypothetical protein